MATRSAEVTAALRADQEGRKVKPLSLDKTMVRKCISLS